MYISLFIVVIIVGFFLILLPTSIIQKISQHKWFCIFQRLVGAIIVLAGALTTYALASGAIVLPLFK